jgi:hypothetical protein
MWTKMRTYVKLEGADVKEGVKALEQLALHMPEVCITDLYIDSEAPMFNDQTGIMNYFAAEGDAMEKRCAIIISKSGVKLEGNDFVFEWFVKPSNQQMQMLTEKMDETLKPLGLKYTLKSK